MADTQSPVKFKVDDARLFLESEEYGHEDLLYPSHARAIEGLMNLLGPIIARTQKDGVTRRVGFIIEATNLNQV